MFLLKTSYVFLLKMPTFARKYEFLMKILILNSSPRRHGNVSKMLEVMRREAEEKGAEVIYVYVPELDVHPCIGCMKCRSALKCCLPEDGAQRVLQAVKDADALIIGATLPRRPVCQKIRWQTKRL